MTIIAKPVISGAFMKTSSWRIRILPLLSLALLGGLVIPPLHGADKTVISDKVRERVKKDLFFLASPECEGRGPQTKGLDLAGDYIAEEFKKIGLKPVGKDHSYFQHFKIAGAKLDEPPSLEVQSGKEKTLLAPGTDFHALGLSTGGKFKGPVVFAGFGLTVDGGKKYDDFAGIDAKDKIALVIRDLPRFKEESKIFETAFKKRQAASLTEKINNAEKHGAKAILIVNDRDTAKETKDSLLPFEYTSLSRATGKIPAFMVSRKVAAELLKTTNKTFDDLQEKIENTMANVSQDVPGVEVSVDLKITRGKDVVPLRNVAGILEGAGPLANEIVVIGAHYDHLGYGGQSSLAGLKKISIHHGADDNASGTTGMMELARRFASMKNRQGRGLLFMAFSGEELGLFGSAYYASNPLIPLKETAAMVNLDMIGRLKPDEKTKEEKVLLEGTGTAEIFEPLLEQLNKETRFHFVKKKSGFGPSDHSSFCDKKIPVLFFWTGTHPEYHTPQDTADRINFDGLLKITGLVENLVVDLSQREKKPTFVEVKGNAMPRPTGNFPKLGIRPGYTDEAEGVLVEGVTEGEPAAKSGIKKGDRILEISGKKVPNIETYMQVLAGEKNGTTINVQIIRDGKKITVPVKLGQ